jgi:membrane protease YdiL (CAAX protease family)
MQESFVGMKEKISEVAANQSTPLKGSVALFFILAYIYTWTLHLAILLLGLTFTFDITSPSMLLYLVGILGPLASAIFVTARSEGMAGVKKLLKSALRWRFNPVWYIFAIFVIASLMFADIAFHIKAIPTPSQWIGFPLLLIAGQLWVVIGEEYGWRGFALPRLQNLIGSLGASLALGFLWASWHLPMFFIPGSPQYTDSFFYMFPIYVLIVTFWSIIMTMLYNRANGSVLVCMIFHASLNIAAFTIRMPGEANIMIYLYIPVVILSIILLPRPLFSFEFSKTRNCSGR